jgi:tetratricopeptide (TPR) repeat protein
MPTGLWRAGAGFAESRLLRAEEALLPFDSARQPEIDKLNEWLDDTERSQTVRLITGAGGQGKTRLSLELCQQRIESGWRAGFLDSELDAGKMDDAWQTLRAYGKPLLIVIDYAETRQPAFLSLLKASLQNSSEHPVRMLLLARDGGEWWDNLPSKDSFCESFLSGYATSGPFRLPPMYAAETDRRTAFDKALKAFAEKLGAQAPSIIPILAGEHFERPLYIQMAALLALHGEAPTTAQGLTRALLNHERRYWNRLLAQLNWVEPARRAERLLALTTLAGNFATPRDAERYWEKAGGGHIPSAEFGHFFRALASLYPGTQGLQALRPDLLGEALVAQALLHQGGEQILDAVLEGAASRPIRRNALTVLARLSNQRQDVHEILTEALKRHFGSCCQDIFIVAAETNSLLPELAEAAFMQLPFANKSQVAGLLKSSIMEESVQLARLNCAISGHLVEQSKKHFEAKRGNQERMAEYAANLVNHALNLGRIGRSEEAGEFDRMALKLSSHLSKTNPVRFEPAHATSLNNYAMHLSEAGRNEEALEHGKQALEIRRRLTQKNPDRFEPGYASSLNNYAGDLSEAGRYEEALENSKQALEIRGRLAQKEPDRFEPRFATSLSNHAKYLREVGRYEEALESSKQALEIRRRLTQKNPDRFEPDYTTSLGNHASYLSEAGRYEEALENSNQALEIERRLSQKNPDRFEPDYATSLSNYAIRLSEAGRYEEALEHDKQALEIRRRLSQKNSDRFEPNFASSLSNYAYELSEVGRYDEALEHSSQALGIHRRLTQKNPARFADELFIGICLTQFLAWLNFQDREVDGSELGRILLFIPEHQRPLMLLFSAFVEGCVAKEQTARATAFRRAFFSWSELSTAGRTYAEPYYLCAAAWCAANEPAESEGAEWLDDWRRFRERRQGRIPQWMSEVARRLQFPWPES